MDNGDRRRRPIPVSGLADDGGDDGGGTIWEALASGARIANASKQSKFMCIGDSGNDGGDVGGERWWRRWG